MKRFPTVLAVVLVIFAILGYATAFVNWKIWYDRNFFKVEFRSSIKYKARTLSTEAFERFTELLPQVEMWHDVTSIELAYPWSATDGRIPYYFEELQRGKHLCDELGFLDEPAVLVPYGQLSEQEKFILARRTPKVGDEHLHKSARFSRDWTLLQLMRESASQIPLDEAPNPFARSDIIAQAAFDMLPFSYSREEELSRDEWLMLTAKRCVNPLSGRVTSLSSTELSPGDCYCRLILDNAKLDAMRAKDTELKTTYYPGRWPTFCYAYYRVYGESSVIAEGLLRVTPRGLGQSRDGGSSGS